MGVDVAVRAGFLEDAHEVHDRIAARRGLAEPTRVGIVDDADLAAGLGTERCEGVRRALRPHQRACSAWPRLLAQSADQATSELAVRAGHENRSVGLGQGAASIT